jgi:hypothetical protein
MNASIELELKELELDMIVDESLEKNLNTEDEGEVRNCGLLKEDKSVENNVEPFTDDLEYLVPEPESIEDIYPEGEYESFASFKTVPQLKQTLQLYGLSSNLPPGILSNGMSFSLIQDVSGKFLPISQEEIEFYEKQMNCKVESLDNYQPREVALMNKWELFNAALYAARKQDLYLLKQIVANNIKFPESYFQGVLAIVDIASVINWETIPQGRRAAWIEFIGNFLSKDEDESWDTIYCRMLTLQEDPNLLGNTWFVTQVIDGKMSPLTFKHKDLVKFVQYHLDAYNVKLKRQNQNNVLAATVAKLIYVLENAHKVDVMHERNLLEVLMKKNEKKQEEEKEEEKEVDPLLRTNHVATRGLEPNDSVIEDEKNMADDVSKSLASRTDALSSKARISSCWSNN